MNREFLKKLGLEDEVIESVMAKHGATIQELNEQVSSEKTKAEKLQEQMVERNKDLKGLREQLGDNAEIESELESLQTKYKEDTQKFKEELDQNRKMSEIRLNITKAGAKNEKAVLALLDVDEIKINDDGVQGLKEQIDALKESDAYLFGPNEKGPRIVSPGNPKGRGDGSLTREQIMQEKDDAKRQKLISENPELFR